MFLDSLKKHYRPAAALPVERPAFDLEIPARLETATLALG